MMRRIKRLLPILIPLLCAILVVLLFRTVFFLGYVPTASMEPTIPKGSLILGLRIAACPGETYILNGSPITVPPDHYLLLGDNSAASYDARYWELPCTPADDIIAKLP